MKRELHRVGLDRNVPAVTAQPDRVWEIPGAPDIAPAIPKTLRHGANAWALDRGHDWSMRGPSGCLRFSPGGGPREAWLVCEWDDGGK